MRQDFDEASVSSFQLGFDKFFHASTGQSWNWGGLIFQQNYELYVDIKEILNVYIKEWCKSAVCSRVIDVENILTFLQFNFLNTRVVVDQEYVKVNFCNSVSSWRKQLSVKTLKCNESASRYVLTSAVPK